MKIALIEIRPVAGAIKANQEQHIFSIQQAAQQGADLVVFPELSLTGYEPTLAADLAFELSDKRLDSFQQLSDRFGITIGIGLPLRAKRGITISMAIFQPHQARQFYAKQYLHADEEPYFVPGKEPLTIKLKGRCVAFTICYELFVPEHAERALSNGADIYLASVAKSASGMERAKVRLRAIALKYAVPVLIVNSVGPADDFVAVGNSMAWGGQGELLRKMNLEKGMLMFDLGD